MMSLSVVALLVTTNPVYAPCAVGVQCGDIRPIQTPPQQLRLGTESKDVLCHDGFVLIIKSENGSPACVKSQTVQKLVERGWGLKISPSNIEPGTSHANKTITATNIVDANNIFMLDYYSTIKKTTVTSFSYHGVS